MNGTGGTPATMLIIGHARLPQGTTARDVSGTVALNLEIDVKYGVIVDVDCSLVLAHSRAFIRRLLVGHSLADGVADRVGVIEEVFHGNSQAAIVAALRDAHRKFLELRDGVTPGGGEIAGRASATRVLRVD